MKIKGGRSTLRIEKWRSTGYWVQVLSTKNKNPKLQHGWVNVNAVEKLDDIVGRGVYTSPKWVTSAPAKPVKHRDGGGGSGGGGGVQLKSNTDFLQPPCVENGNCSFQNRSGKHSNLLQQDARHEYNLRLINVTAIAGGPAHMCWVISMGKHSEWEWICTDTQFPWLLDPISLQFELYRNQGVSFHLSLCSARSC